MAQIRYELKTPWRNGTTHVIFEPLDFISRLVALVPKPHVNLTRFHGVFVPYADVGIMRPKVAITGPQQGSKVFTLQTLPDYQSDKPIIPIC
jgi:hypothetical protein